MTGISTFVIMLSEMRMQVSKLFFETTMGARHAGA
jgi:hypothetical protein